MDVRDHGRVLRPARRVRRVRVPAVAFSNDGGRPDGARVRTTRVPDPRGPGRRWRSDGQRHPHPDRPVGARRPRTTHHPHEVGSVPTKLPFQTAARAAPWPLAPPNRLRPVLAAAARRPASAAGPAEFRASAPVAQRARGGRWAPRRARRRATSVVIGSGSSAASARRWSGPRVRARGRRGHPRPQNPGASDPCDASGARFAARAIQPVLDRHRVHPGLASGPRAGPSIGPQTLGRYGLETGLRAGPSHAARPATRTGPGQGAQHRPWPGVRPAERSPARLRRSERVAVCWSAVPGRRLQPRSSWSGGPQMAPARRRGNPGRTAPVEVAAARRSRAPPRGAIRRQPTGWSGRKISDQRHRSHSRITRGPNAAARRARPAA